MAASCIALATGCGDDNTTPDAAVKRDTGVDSATSKDAAGDGATPDGGVVSDGPVKDGSATDGSATDAPATDAPASDAAAADGPVLNAQQARGQYIVDVTAACGDCHTPRTNGAPDMNKYLAGTECLISLPPNGDAAGDCLNSRNLTNDPTGLANRSADDIKNMFQHGMRPDPAGAVPLNPFMPYYIFANMTADDADAVVAYLRTVKAVNHTVPRSGMAFTVPAAAPALDPNTIPVPQVGFAELESALRGRYLATEAGVCIECHTKHNAPGPGPVLDPAKYFQGGEEFPLGLPALPVSKNLTSDATTGLGNWSAADIVKVLKMGIDKDGKGICPPMPVGPNGAFGHLKDQDAMDIANYIKSLPPAVNMIVDMCSTPFPPPPDAASNMTVDAASDASTD